MALQDEGQRFQGRHLDSGQQDGFTSGVFPAPPPPPAPDHVGDVNAVFSLEINGDFWDFGPWLKYCQPLSHPDAPLVSVMRNH